MEISGYKALNLDMTNRYGKKFEVGKTYSVEGELKFGNDGNGFHFCERMEDTLRYFDDAIITEIKSLEDYIVSDDIYNGYDNLYCARTIRIERIISREEIISYFLNCNDKERIKRFIQGYKLTEQEIELFKIIFGNPINYTDIINTILYYQECQYDLYDKINKKTLL